VTGLGLAGAMFVGMLVLMALRVPIAAAMALAGALGYAAQAGGMPLANFLNTQAFARFASADLAVIPLFLLMGHLAAQGGLAQALFSAAAAALRGVRGGLPMATVLACGAFGSICGSSVATAATVTQVALPELRRQGFAGGFSTATLAAGGTLGILVPPSVPLVIYAILTEQNIAQLFAAAVLPAVLAVCGYLLVIAWVVRRAGPSGAGGRSAGALAGPLVDGAGTRAPVPWRGVLPIAAVFLLVFGGIYGGAFTPNEGAAIGVAGTFVAAWWRGGLSRRGLLACATGTAGTTAMIFLIFLGADLMNAALALTQVPAALAAAVEGWAVSPWLVVAGILAFYIVLGTVMDELSMLLLTLPIVFPIVMGLDLGLTPRDTAVWFGVLVLMTVSFGLLAPPVGLNVYVVHGLARDVPIGQTYRAVLPFLAADLLRLLLLLVFPPLSLALVRWVG